MLHHCASKSPRSLQQPTADQPAAPETSVTVNGQPVELPVNQRINQKIEDEHGTTRIRGRIDAGSGTSSITISTGSSTTEAD